jgi:Ca2+-binding EF-hand superfamily protein
MFDTLRIAVNKTHGSLHQAFLAWDKGGNGELSKARVRVGLRACKGAKEQEIQDFITEAFENDEIDRIGFNKLFHVFQKGESRFSEDASKWLTRFVSLHRVLITLYSCS